MPQQNLNETINDNIQTKTLEKDPILELFEVGTKHLQNLENNIGSFLKEHGVISDTSNSDLNDKINSYDGNVEGDTNNIEKIKSIQDILAQKPNKIKKNQLTIKLIHSLIQANSKEHISINQIFKDSGKEMSSQDKQDLSKIMRLEQIEMQKDLAKVNRKIDSEKSIELSENYTQIQVDAKNQIIKIAKELKIDISNLERKDLYNLNTLAIYKNKITKHIVENQKKLVKKLSLNTKESSVTLKIERDLASNNELAQEYGVEKETTKGLGKWIEWSMQSGILPLGMMAAPQLRKTLPMLPSVIGIGVWSRLMHGTVSDKFDVIGETVMAIAPITGTYVAYQDAMKAKSTGDKVAAWSGFAVSAGFDAFTVFLVATGIGAPAAVGTQALKVTAKESTKLAVKKFVSFFTREAVEQAPRAYGTLGQVSKEFVKGKFNIVKNAVKNLGGIEFTKRVLQQGLKDTVEGIWSIISLKGLREVKGINNINKLTFGKVSEATKGARVELFKKMEKAGLVKEGASKRAQIAGTIEEIRLIQHETLKESGQSTITSKESHLSQIESTKNLDNILSDIQKLAKNTEGDSKEFKNILNAIKKQDQNIGNAMDTVKKVTLEITELHSGVNSKEQVVQKIDYIINSSEGKISDGLKNYLKNVSSKINNGEDFGPKTGNFLLLLNKFNGQLSIASYSQQTDALKDYYSLIKNGEKESRYGYGGNYLRVLSSLKEIINGGEFSQKNSKELIVTYMDIIKSAEKSGWGTIRMELMNPSLASKVDSGEINNGYEYNLNQLLNQDSISSNISTVIENIDFSMIHSIDVLKNITNKTFAEIKLLNENNPKKAIELINKLSGNTETAKILKSKLKSGEGVEIINILTKMDDLRVEFLDNGDITKIGNRDLIKLLDYLTYTDDIQIVKQKIQKNVENNDQINPGIGKDINSMTKETLDNTLRDLNKLGEDSYKKALDTIIEKVTGKTLSNLSQSELDITLMDFYKNIESYDVAANFCKNYPQTLKEVSRDILIGNEASIDYKIKYLIELENLGLDSIKYRKVFKVEFKKIIENIGQDNNKLSDYDYNNIIKNLDNIEAFYIRDSKGNIGNKDILIKLNALKESKQYKKQNQKVNETLLLLLDLDRTHSMEFLKTQKTAGNITYKTKQNIDIYIQHKAIITDDGKIIKKLNDSEIKRLENVRLQIKEVLDHYEFNLFDKTKFDSLKGNKEQQVNYIYNTIDQHTSWSLSGKATGDIDYKRLTKTISSQLNSISNNFSIDSKVIDGVVSKILSDTHARGLDISKKIHLLKLLERAGIIKPSAEQKLDYIIDIKPKNANDFRNNTSDLKDYSKYFDQHLAQGNKDVIKIKLKFKDNPKEAKAEMEKYILSILDTKTPVSNQSILNKGPEFKEGRDYVIIDGKNYITEVYPSRYFIQQLTKGNLDVRQKEAYMEMIHNKTEFGGISFKEYFASVTDIETKILMSYHDSIKYDTEVLDLLKKHAKNPKYNQLVNYVLSKRNDYDLIKGGENLNEGVLKSYVTKEYLEEKIGHKIDTTKYKETLEQLEKIIIALRSMTNAQIGSRQLEEIIPDIKNNDIIQILLKNDTHLRGIINNVDSKVSFIKKLLKDNIIGSMIAVARYAEETKQDLDKLLEEMFKYNRNNSTDRALINNEEILQNPEKIDTIKLIKNSIEKNKKLLILPVIGKIIMTPTEAQAAEQKIGDTWEKSPAYTEYLKAMEAGDLKTATEIKKATVNEITKVVLKDYIADFKDKYEAKYLAKFQDFPLGLRDLTGQIHDKLSSSVKDKSEKGRNGFAKSIYDFISHYNKEDGKAEKYARRLLDKVEGGTGTPLANIIINMGNQSDIEAAKSPEQKQREYEEFIANENKKQAASQRSIDSSQRSIDSSQRSIDSSQRSIDKRNELIERMKSI